MQLRHQRILSSSKRHFSWLGKLFNADEELHSRRVYDTVLQEYVKMQTRPRMVLESDSIMSNVLIGVSESFYSSDRRDEQFARQALEKAKELSNASPCSQHERLHIDALQAILDRNLPQAATLYEILLHQNQTDLLALRTAHDVFIQLGDSQNTNDVITRVLPSWTASLPGYSSVLSMHAFGLQEMGQYTRAIEVANGALSMDQKDGWAMNAIVHSYENQGLHNIGASFINQHRSVWEQLPLLRDHMYGHWALFSLEMGDTNQIDRFIKLYLLRIKEDVEPSTRTLMDATILCWKLRFSGADTIEYFSMLKDAWNCVDNPSMTPLENVLRYSVACLTEENPDLVRLSVEPLSIDVPHDTLVNHYSTDDAARKQMVYETACRAFQAYNSGNSEGALESLKMIKNQTQILGGAKSDHDLFQLLSIEASINSGRFKTARDILHERIGMRSSSGQTWSKYAHVLDNLNDPTAAGEARHLAYTLGLGQAGAGAA